MVQVQEAQSPLRAREPGAADRLTPVPDLLPLSTRKVRLDLPTGASYPTPGKATVTVTLLPQGGKGVPLDRGALDLDVRAPDQPRRVTFVSDIDGSVQYYALAPRRGVPDAVGPPALILSLHGAGVEAIGQAQAYGPKAWATLVAPTNRRPFGYDWEDWGRLDALEVLALAQSRYVYDPRRVYLVGHSMGGHGTWQLGALFPGRFAAIGPSAGWISFSTYPEPSPLGALASVGRAFPGADLQMFLRAALSSDTLSFASNYAQEGVYILHGADDHTVPVAQAREMRDQLAAFHHDFAYHEQPGADHWWDVSDEPGADCVDWPPMFDFLTHHQIPQDAEVREVEFATPDPGVSSQCHWAEIQEQIHRLQPSSVDLRVDPGLRRFTGVTRNVAHMTLDLGALFAPGPVSLDIDGQKIGPVPYPPGRCLGLERGGAGWSVSGPPPAGVQSPAQCGPFKAAFRHRVVLVYGTRGTAEEDAWALSKARFDQETFWYVGNGSMDVVSDEQFLRGGYPGRSVVLYGNADTNAAWGPLLAGSPVRVRRGSVVVGGDAFSGGGYACLFIRPRPGGGTATVGVVSGTGPVGFRLTDRQRYLAPGVEFPDCTVMSLREGAAAPRLDLTGFYAADWGVGGDFIRTAQP